MLEIAWRKKASSQEKDNENIINSCLDSKLAAVIDVYNWKVNKDWNICI